MADSTKGSLAGLRIALTREAADNARLGADLAGRGAQVLSCPLVRVELADPGSVVLARPGYDWLAVTSRRAVAWLDWRLGRAEPPRFERLACVGEATAAYTRQVLKREPLVPTVQTAAALAAAMGDVTGRTVLFPRGDLAKDTLASALRAGGALVDDPVVYHTRADDAGAAKLKALVAAARVDAVVFASPSAVHFAVAGGVNLAGLRCFSIGPSTTDALRAHGMAVAAEAATHDEKGLIAVIVKSEAR